MSVASRNAFALLDDDPSAPVAPAAPKQADAAAAAAAPKRSIPGLNNNAAPARNGAPRDARSRGPAGGEGGDADAPQRRDTRNARGGRSEGARGAGRGGRGRGAGGRGGRGRAFDRHSQTGKTDSDKKLEQGWGGDDPKRELDAEDGGKADAAAEEGADGEKKDGDAAPTTNGSADKKEVIVEEEEEKDNTKTLDEYLAEQAAKRAQIGGGAQQVRQAEVDDSTLGQKVTKQLGDDYYSSAKERSTRQRERKEKQVLEIEQNFTPPPSATRGSGRGGRGGDRGRGGRGGERGRGGDRGRGSRGGIRAGRGGSSAGGANINLADSNAFPTLG